MIRIFVLAASLAFATSAMADMAGPQPPVEAATTTAPSAVVKKLVSSGKTAAGQPIRLPQGDVELTVLSYDIPPGAKLPVHKHPHPRYAYVVAGRLKVSSADGATSAEYGPGDVIIEMIDAWHYGETIGSEPVKLLVFDQAPTGETNTILK